MAERAGEKAWTANAVEPAKQAQAPVSAGRGPGFPTEGEAGLCPALQGEAFASGALADSENGFGPGSASSAPHTHAESHHHHTHAATSHHAHGHHLLQVSHLSVGFRMYDPDAPYFSAAQRTSFVIDDLSISVHAGEIVAVVGASGSGKTLLADCIMGLFEPNADVRGEIWFDGELMGAAALAAVRGRGISLVPQSVSHFDSLMRVGKQVEGFGFGTGQASQPAKAQASAPPDETFPQLAEAQASGFPNEVGNRRKRSARRSLLSRSARQEKRRALFERYGLNEGVARLYPHELSGGMARRVLLCCALMDDPLVIIADEPTPGLDLDLAVQALADFRTFADGGGGVMLITHDIELALRVADRVAVFKDGTIVEETSVANFASPDTLAHPFSKALWHALPEHGFECEKGTVPFSHSSSHEGGELC